MKEERTCQNCKSPFIIEDEDFQFYKKIDVPPPTWCPECRMVRRMVWRNERALYKRKSNSPVGGDIISMYAPEKQFVVYEPDFWWSDKWNPLNFGVEYNFSKNFFEQFKELFWGMPQLSLSIKNMVDSPYCNVSADEKECYFISASGCDERVLYSNRIALTKDSVDLYVSDRNELCYEVIDSSQCYRLFFSEKCDMCVDSYFLYNCSNCQNCFGCFGLRNKNFYIYNKPYTKEEYFQTLNKFNLGSYDFVKREQKHFFDFFKTFPRKFAFILKSTDCIGDNIKNSKNCKYAFDTFSTENSKYLVWTGFGMKDSYDSGVGGGLNLELIYESWDISYGGNSVFFSSVSYECHNIFYSIYCHGCSHLFGCVGLRNKEYCILNKQYTKEEYEELVPKIKEHINQMPYVDKKGRVYKYGEFFPPELSPFAYNETIAQEYFPLTKEEAQEKGYGWRDPDTKDYKPTILSKDLPDHIKDVPDSITKEIIQCAHTKLTTDNQQPKTNCNHQCTTAFRIVPEELQFYRRMNPARPDDPSGRSGGLPLPRLCPNCRHYERLAQRNPLKLWHRKCMCAGRKSEIRDAKSEAYTNTATHFHGSNPCPNEFETSYSPERGEIVYCERCYQQEVI